MLDQNRTRGVTSQMIPLHSSITSLAEGTLLASVVEGGKGVVLPTDGNSGQRIAGVARSQHRTPTTAKKTETFKVPASPGPYTVTLAKAPLNPSTAMGAWIDGSAGTYDTTPDASLDWFVSDRVITFHSSDAGKTVKVQYDYALTVIEAQMLYGEGIGDAGMSVVNGTEVITSAQEIWTDMYDPTDDWDNGGLIYSGAGGMFTLKTSGTLVSNAYVLSAPSQNDRAFLGIYFSV